MNASCRPYFRRFFRRSRPTTGIALVFLVTTIIAASWVRATVDVKTGHGGIMVTPVNSALTYLNFCIADSPGDSIANAENESGAFTVRSGAIIDPELRSSLRQGILKKRRR